ncbi:hypothetical protein [Burkholderia gladioli]|uniref:hypothetical protein n=1 Tax=Burkholderia gladioli TaxID=28095 RepID=UPI001642022F|nr:hypothetical protein [Burkholderia gladioli]
MARYNQAAIRAAKRGDIRESDAIELAHIAASVPLYSTEHECYIRATAVRYCRGAGPRGEARVEWALPGGIIVLSDVDGLLLPEFDDAVFDFLASAPAAAYDWEDTLVTAN